MTGTVNAAPTMKLVIASNNSNVTFGFGEDTSGTLVVAGVSTRFSPATM